MGRLTRKVFLTQEGLQKLNQELDELIRVKRPRVLERIQEAREFGDLMENSGYDAAKEDQSIIEGRIQELQDVIAKAKIIQFSSQKNDFVVIGSTVVVEVDGQVDEFTIVGSLEADPSKKKISDESPVGQALLGAKEGEMVEVITPIVRANYKIIKVK
jgi:transcription elongation factor GreA